MKVLMLGWEYPPHISGGLGTACEGLTKALSRFSVDIEFVVPELIGGEKAPHMSLVDSLGLSQDTTLESVDKKHKGRKERIHKIGVPAFLSPYWSAQNFSDYVSKWENLYRSIERGSKPGFEWLFEEDKRFPQKVERYGHNIFEEVSRYAANVLLMAGGVLAFDVVHAHDWMTFPAGVALAKLSGKPLVVHIHSLEFDRSGDQVNSQINDIERMGLETATTIIAVSYYTSSLIQKLHGIHHEKISVVHNGVYPRKVVQSYKSSNGTKSKVVLFLGRITFQKGPDYFVEAAARVIAHVPDVLFVMAGSGDMLPRMQRRVAELGISKHFLFSGFLKGSEVEKMYSIADLYVMPSVSEPFGISALEAISYDTPVIISRQSGVAEVLGHALKVDFWDIDRLSDLMINALLHGELREDMVAMAQEEIKRLHWEASALKTLEIYRRVM